MEKTNSKKQTIDLSFVEVHSFGGTDIYFEMNALTGELGELANIVKKQYYATQFPRYKKELERQFAEGRPNFYEQQVDEAGDILFYYIKVLNMLGISLEDVVYMQTMKLANQSIHAEETFKK